LLMPITLALFTILFDLKSSFLPFLCRSDPPSLESALIAVREVKEASVSSSTPTAAAAADHAAAAVAAAVAVTPQEATCPAELSSAADAALKHLLLYVDVDQLYRTALGLYDLSLAFMVVGHSQKDPGEYLAELTAFGSQSDVSLRCHAIDMSLGRYDKALGHLVAAGPVHFEAALKFAKDRGLLRQLLALTQQQQQQGEGAGQQLVAVLSAYGDSLLDARKAEDAAVAYSAAGLTLQALGAYK
jgi:elongator complex protein 1